MAKLKVITVNQSVFAENDAIAAETREALRKKGLLFLNVMASPGAGKTTLLLATIRALKQHGGVEFEHLKGRMPYRRDGGRH